MKWDRSWVQLPKKDEKYRACCVEFIELDFKHSAKNNKMSCPCRDCKNKKWLEKDSALVHLLTKGWHQDYARIEQWHFYNEPTELPPPPSNDTNSQGFSDVIFQGGAE